MISDDNASCVSTLKGDIEVKKFKKMIKEGDFAIDVPTLMAELDRMHATRNVRLINYGDVMHNAQEKIVDALLQNQAYRSRCVEIKMKCFKTLQKLNHHYEKLTNYLIATYRKELSVYKTKADRDSAVASILEKGKYHAQQLEVVTQIADYIIEDIDKAAWAIKSLVEVLKISTQPEMV